MFSIRRRTLAAGAALTAAFLAVCAGPAPAATSANWSTVTIPCVNLVAVSRTVFGSTVHLSGSVQPCVGTQAGARDWFGIGWYEALPGGQQKNVTQYPMSYASMTGRTAFAVGVPVGRAQPALCIAFRSNRRLACYQVSQVNGVVQVASIPVNDPRVLYTLPNPVNEFTVVSCGTCWPK